MLRITFGQMCFTHLHLLHTTWKRAHMPLHYIYLIIAVATETIGTSALQASQQLTRFWPTALAVGSYAISFWLLALTMKYMPVGIVYALWSGMGIIFIAIIGYVLFRQKLDMPAILGLGLIILGIVVIQLYSKTANH